MNESYDGNGSGSEGGALEYRIVDGGIVVIRLGPAESVLAEPGRLLYRRGDVRWSMASTGRPVLDRIMNRAMRRAADVGSLMHHYAGPGELAFSASPSGRLVAAHLKSGDNLVVDRRCLVAAAPGVTIDVAFSRSLRLRRHAGKVVLMRLTGIGVAFLQAHGSSTELVLEAGEELEAPAPAVMCFEASAEYELRLARVTGVSLRKSGLEWMAALTGPGRVTLQTPPGDSP